MRIILGNLINYKTTTMLYHLLECIIIVLGVMAFYLYIGIVLLGGGVLYLIGLTYGPRHKYSSKGGTKS